jgi:hypothetical protein
MKLHQKNQIDHVMVETPTDNDILCGRGGESNNAKGNRRYQKVIEEFSRDYALLSSRKAKTQFAWKIYSRLKEEGYRFLVREKGSRFWTEAPEEACRKKISQRLRERALDGRDGEKKAPPPEEVVKEEIPSSDTLEGDAVVSMDQLLPEDALDVSDGSIESLVEFADDFPSSWIDPEPEQSQNQFAIGSMGFIGCNSVPLVGPGQVVLSGAPMDQRASFPSEQYQSVPFGAGSSTIFKGYQQFYV